MAGAISIDFISREVIDTYNQLVDMIPVNPDKTETDPEYFKNPTDKQLLDGLHLIFTNVSVEEIPTTKDLLKIRNDSYLPLSELVKNIASPSIPPGEGDPALARLTLRYPKKTLSLKKRGNSRTMKR